MFAQKKDSGNTNFFAGKRPAVNRMETFADIRNALQGSQESGTNTYVSAALGQWVQDQFARKRTPADLDEEVAALEKEFTVFEFDFNDIRRIYGIGKFNPDIPSLQERNAARKQAEKPKGFVAKFMRIVEKSLTPTGM